jgi:hypothetical protein
MRSASEVRLVLRLSDEGLNNCEIARRTGVPRGTVRDWVRGKALHRLRDETCTRCGETHIRFDPPNRDYAYLLGLYLGDGMLSLHPRGVYRLRITLDARYPGIVSECARSMRGVLPGVRVLVQANARGACSEVSAYSKGLPCLFPQHGAGPKHSRSIQLEPWQQSIVEEHPQQFLRGLIHSDGCRSTNTVRCGRKVYRYPRYTFSNASADIRRIFCEACSKLGIRWRRMNARNISVARRESVELLDAFVGSKS